MRIRTAAAFRRGSALLSVTVITMLLAALAVALTTLVIAQNRRTLSTVQGTDALYIAQAGLGNALQELRADRDYDGDGTIGTASGTFSAGRYVVAMASPGDGTRILTATANKDGIRRAIEVRVQDAVPIPGANAEAAVAIYGQLGKKGKIDLHVKQGEADEDGTGGSSSSPIAIDGHDQAGVKDLPGIGIEDPVTYDAVASKLAERIDKGKISEDAVIGNPMVTIGDNKHTAEASLVEVGGGGFDAAHMGEIAFAIEDVVDSKLIPSANQVYSGNNITFKTPQVWGSSFAPQIVVLDGSKMTMENGAAISGHGTLVITGDLKMNNGSSLNWTGDIIIMGGNKDAVLKNNQGQLNVAGNVVVLGTSPDKAGKSVFSLHDDNGKNVATNTIDGALLVITGDKTDKAEKAEVKIKHGNTTINGLVSIVGDKTKFDVHTHDEGVFQLNGALALAVWGNDDKHKAKLHLHGENIGVHYHSVEVQEAVEGLMDLAGLSDDDLPPMWTVLAWREIVPDPSVLP